MSNINWTDFLGVPITREPVNELNCLAATHPEIATQWHPIKNGDLTPYDVTYGCAKKVWWQCEEGHEWKTPVFLRTSGYGCPRCANNRVYENSLSVDNPKMASEWHPTKNGNLTPDDVTLGCAKKVWWQCKNGHEWQTEIKTRAKGHDCPFCSNQRACKDNCLATLRPETATFWHPTKNGDLTPNDVTYGSAKTVWWLCPTCDHEWQDPIHYLMGRVGKCPKCNRRRRRFKYEKRLAVTHPEVAKQWHPTKNGDLTPNDVTYGVNVKVVWQCEKGHEWITAINSRTSRGGYGCPYCAGVKACADNCLATTHPELAKQWHPTKNGDLTSSDVTYGSEKRVWWLCAEGHEISRTILGRTYRKSHICPVCLRKQKKRNKARILV